MLRRISVLLFAVALLLVVSGGAVGAAPATVQTFDTAVGVTNPCSGEVFNVYGTLRTVTRLKDGFDEGQILYIAMKGEGADGTTYLFTYSQGSTIHVAPGLVQTFEVNYALIGLGSAPDLHLHELFHVTFDANGQMTILNHDLSVTC